MGEQGSLCYDIPVMRKYIGTHSEEKCGIIWQTIMSTYWLSHQFHLPAFSPMDLLVEYVNKVMCPMTVIATYIFFNNKNWKQPKYVLTGIG